MQNRKHMGLFTLTFWILNPDFCILFWKYSSLIPKICVHLRPVKILLFLQLFENMGAGIFRQRVQAWKRGV